MGLIPVNQSKPGEQADWLSTVNVTTLINQATTVCYTLIDIYNNASTYMWIIAAKVMQIGAGISLIFGIGMFIHGSPTNSIFPFFAAFTAFKLGETWIIQCHSKDAHSRLINTFEKTSECVETLNEAIKVQEKQRLEDRATHLEEKAALEQLAEAQLAAQKEQADQQIGALGITIDTLATAGGENLKQQLDVLEKLETINLHKEQREAIQVLIDEALDEETLPDSDRARWNTLRKITTSKENALAQLKARTDTSRKVLTDQLAKCGSAPNISENSHPNIVSTQAS
ncbi:MAG: hypothetical protein H7A40_00065 [Chlamydiales bacterium]|nr:hypothetical protein [Chlamydiales bacterium]